MPSPRRRTRSDRVETPRKRDCDRDRGRSSRSRARNKNPVNKPPAPRRRGRRIIESDEDEAEATEDEDTDYADAEATDAEDAADDTEPSPVADVRRSTRAADKDKGSQEAKDKEGKDEMDAEKAAEVWAQFSADHYEIVEQLPLELHRNSRLLRELDEESIAQQEKLQARIREYVAYRLALARPKRDPHEASEAPEHRPDAHVGGAPTMGVASYVTAEGTPAESVPPAETQSGGGVPAEPETVDETPALETPVVETPAVEGRPAEHTPVVEATPATGPRRESTSGPPPATTASSSTASRNGTAAPNPSSPDPSPGELHVGDETRDSAEEAVDDLLREDSPPAAEVMERAASPPQAALQANGGDNPGISSAGQEGSGSAAVRGSAPPAAALQTSARAPSVLPYTSTPAPAARTATPSGPRTATPAEHTPRAALSSIAALARELVRNREEKVAIAVGAYNLIDRHIRALDSALSSQETSVLGLGEAAVVAPVPLAPVVVEPPKGPRRGKKKRKSGTSVPEPVPLVLEPQIEIDADPNEPRYCYCNNVSYGEMVGCDNEDCPYEWFHLGCLGLSAAPTGDFLCEACKPQPAAVPPPPKKRKR